MGLENIMLSEVTQLWQANGSCLAYADPGFGFLCVCINVGASVYIDQGTRAGSLSGVGFRVILKVVFVLLYE